MKTGFKDPIKIKSQHPKDEKPQVNSKMREYGANYDQRSSAYVNTGTYYGVGHNQPIGSKAIKVVDGVPMGRVDTLSVDVAGYGQE